MKHEALETVDEVVEAKGFVVFEGQRRTNRAGCEVRGITDAGCKAHFIGGTKWSH